MLPAGEIRVRLPLSAINLVRTKDSSPVCTTSYCAAFPMRGRSQKFLASPSSFPGFGKDKRDCDSVRPACVFSSIGLMRPHNCGLSPPFATTHFRLCPLNLGFDFCTVLLSKSALKNYRPAFILIPSTGVDRTARYGQAYSADPGKRAN